MAEALSPEEQIASLRLEVAQYRAVIATLTTERDVHQSELAEAAVFKARLTTALLEIEHMRMQLAALRRQRYGQSSEKLDRAIDQLEMWRLSGKAPLGKAFQYALSRWDALTRYVDDGRLSIDNNLAERLLRGIAVTRKNFLFLGSDRGGDRAAIIYTIIESAKLNGLDPEAYLATVLDRMARGHLNTRLEELLPWNFQPPLAKAA